MDRSGIDPAVGLLLKKTTHEVLDYGFVMDCLKEYKNPRVKLNHLLKIGALIRVKKGLYIFGENFARRPFSLETLANMIYGPSYISLEWACQYYQLIPERVNIVTSVTSKRSKEFQTPIGYFSYAHLPLKVFSLGVTLVTVSNSEQALFATKEKALTDLLTIKRGRFKSKKHFKETLFEDLRIEEEDLKTLDCDLLQKIHSAYPHTAINYLIQVCSQ